MTVRIARFGGPQGQRGTSGCEPLGSAEPLAALWSGRNGAGKFLAWLGAEYSDSRDFVRTVLVGRLELGRREWTVSIWALSAVRKLSRGSGRRLLVEPTRSNGSGSARSARQSGTHGSGRHSFRCTEVIAGFWWDLRRLNRPGRTVLVGRFQVCSRQCTALIRRLQPR